MAQSDNTLGAPTEGLGQRVTFAFDSGGAVPQLSLGSTGDIQGGVKGGGPVGVGQTQNVGVKLEANPTFDLIFALADKATQNMANKRKQQAYVIGMQKAAAGEAVADIASEQPWYSKLFGDSDVVEGARQYASHTIAQTTVAQMEDEMPKLREMAPPEAQAYFSSAIQSRMTGDAATDASVMTAFSRALPGVMRRQTKEHYGFLQENATKQETAAFRAGAINLQSQAQALGDDFRTSAEFQGTVQSFIGSVMPAAGRDQDNYKKSMTDNLRTWAQSGQFHALNAVKDSGFFNVLNPDQVVAVEKAIESGETALATKYSMDWNPQLTAIKVASQEADTLGLNAEEIGVKIDTLNQQYSLKTGSKRGLISPADRTAMISGSARTIQHAVENRANEVAAEAKRLGAEGKKADAQMMKDQEIGLSFTQGNLGILNTNPEYGRTAIDSVVFNQWQKMPFPQQIQALVLNDKTSSYTIEPVKRSMVASVTSMLNSETFGPEAQEAFARYKALREENPHTAAEYYGEHAKKLEGLYNDLKMGMAPEGAFRARFSGPAARADFSEKQMAEALKVVGEGQNWFMRQFTGTQKMGPGQQRRIANEISEETKQWYAANGDFETATQIALKASKRNGLEIMGGFAWKNDKNQQPLETFLMKQHPTLESHAIGSDKINEEFYHAVNEKLYGTSGILTDTASDVGVFRMADKAGVPQFRIQSVSRDGEVKDVTLSGTDIFINSAKRKQAAKESTLGIRDENLRFGPENKFRPADDAPSIYGR